MQASKLYGDQVGNTLHSSDEASPPHSLDTDSEETYTAEITIEGNFARHLGCHSPIQATWQRARRRQLQSFIFDTSKSLVRSHKFAHLRHLLADLIFVKSEYVCENLLLWKVSRAWWNSCPPMILHTRCHVVPDSTHGFVQLGSLA